MDAARLSATNAAAAIRDRRLSSVELVKSCLVWIADSERRLGAWESLDPALVLREAKLRDAAAPRGPLHGVPIGIKDIIDTADFPTTYGSSIYKGHRPGKDATVVEKLREAGAIILGKTVTTEFAHLTPGKTSNPHNHSRTPGGSSSGSAAAVAASMVPAALGTQTGGSVIRPAAFCGIYGFKPSYRRTDLDGVKELARSFDTVGWMARAVEDLDLLARVLLLDYKAPAPSKLRVAVCRTPFDDQMQPEAAAALNDIAQALDATEVKLPGNFIELDDAHHTIVAAEAAKAFRREYADFRGQLSDQLRAMLELGLSSSAGTVQTAQGKAVAARTALQRIHRFDALLTASAPGEAPPKSEGTGNAVFSRFWSLLHVPCATLPVASGPSGLPVGVQFVGRPGEDEALIATAIAAAKKLRLY